MNARVKVKLVPSFQPTCQQMEHVIRHLSILGKAEINPLNNEEGICFEIKNKFGGDLMMFVMDAAKFWENYSGNPHYPVPDPFPGEPDRRYLNTSDLWRGRYGELRRNLCLFLAAYHNGDI